MSARWSLGIFHVHWPVRPSLGVTRAKGPAHTSLGQRPGNARATPQVKDRKNNPKRQRRGPISEIIERNMLIPDRASKPFSGVSMAGTSDLRQRPADWQSAIQQINNLRYAKPCPAGGRCAVLVVRFVFPRLCFLFSPSRRGILPRWIWPPT